MGEFFSKAFSGGPFVLFSPTHLVAILAIVLVVVYTVSLRQRGEFARRSFRYVIAALLLANESLWHIWNLVTGQWTVQTMLPLHLCSLFVFLSALLMLNESRRLRTVIYPFAYFLGIAGALQAVLTPDLGIYDFPHFRYFQVFLSHGAIIITAIYLTVIEGYRPTLPALGKVLVGANLYMLFVGVVNWVIGSNYLYIAHKPETASLIDVLGPWPWYLLALEGIGVVMFLLLYLPFAFQDLKTRRAEVLLRG
jgi:hypothetical integral membrane protein (TIGR02206 family)